MLIDCEQVISELLYRKRVHIDFIVMPVLNTCMIYSKNINKLLNHLDFFVSVLEALPFSLSPSDPQYLCHTAAPGSCVSVPGSSGTQEAANVPHEYTKLPDRRERFCAVCPRRSRYWCPGCNVGIHEDCWQKLDHYWRPRGRPRLKKLKCSQDDE